MMAGFHFKNLFTGSRAKDSIQPSDIAPDRHRRFISAIGLESETLRAYDNSNITFKSDLSDTDFDAILRDKQKNIK